MPELKLSWSFPVAPVRWQVLQPAGACESSWHCRQVSIFGSCMRVATETSFIVPWQDSHLILSSTCRLWGNLRFGAGNVTAAGFCWAVRSKEMWQTSQPDGGSAFFPL